MIEKNVSIFLGVVIYCFKIGLYLMKTMCKGILLKKFIFSHKVNIIIFKLNFYILSLIAIQTIDKYIVIYFYINLKKK
jgi:hypothetical protein